jgi:TolA-binding protein
VKTSHEPFESSVRALRDVTATRGDGEVTRARVLNYLAGQKRRRRNYTVALLGVVFLFAVPAISAGWKYLRRAPDLAGGRTHEKTRRALAQRPLPYNIQPQSESPQLAAPLSVPSTISSLAASDSEKHVDVGISEQDWYGRAHVAHFQSHDFKKALRLWTDYVRRYPHGRFLPEAEFNRAVCLVRLGESTAARQALLKLVSSESPDHPKAQAERLLAEIR